MNHYKIISILFVGVSFTLQGMENGAHSKVKANGVVVLGIPISHSGHLNDHKSTMNGDFGHSSPASASSSPGLSPLSAASSAEASPRELNQEKPSIVDKDSIITVVPVQPVEESPSSLSSSPKSSASSPRAEPLETASIIVQGVSPSGSAPSSPERSPVVEVSPKPEKPVESRADEIIPVNREYRQLEGSLRDVAAQNSHRAYSQQATSACAKIASSVVYLANCCRQKPQLEPNLEEGAAINHGEQDLLLPRDRSKKQKMLEEAKVRLTVLKNKLDGFTEALNRLDRNLLKEEVEEVERMITTSKARIEEALRLSDDISKATEVVQTVRLLEKQIGQLPKELKACEELEKLKKPVAELAQKISVLIAEIAREQAGQVAPVAGNNQALIPAAQGVPVQAPVPVVNFSRASLEKTVELTKMMDEFKKGNEKVEQYKEANKKRRCCSNCNSALKQTIDVLIKYGVFFLLAWKLKDPNVNFFAEDNVSASLNRIIQNQINKIRTLPIWVILPVGALGIYGIGYLFTYFDMAMMPYLGFSPGIAPILSLLIFRYINVVLKNFAYEKKE